MAFYFSNLILQTAYYKYYQNRQKKQVVNSIKWANISDKYKKI